MPRIMRRFVVLHNIRSAHNVGSIFRTADGAGVSRIYLTGYTPAPSDRFGRTHEEIVKTSLGATEFVVWEQIEVIGDCLRKLRDDGVEIVAIEQHARAVDYKTFIPTKDIAFIFGNEIDGVPKEVCADADHVLMIPMQGKKESLNVSVAAGIVLFHTL